MSAGDRVAVPTNGHRPALHDEALDAPHHDPSGSKDQPAVSDAGEPAALAPSTTMPAITPGPIIAGVGVLAAVALLILGRRRGG